MNTRGFFKAHGAKKENRLMTISILLSLIMFGGVLMLRMPLFGGLNKALAKAVGGGSSGSRMEASSTEVSPSFDYTPLPLYSGSTYKVQNTSTGNFLFADSLGLRVTTNELITPGESSNEMLQRLKFQERGGNSSGGGWTILYDISVYYSNGGNTVQLRFRFEKDINGEYKLKLVPYSDPTDGYIMFAMDEQIDGRYQIRAFQTDFGYIEGNSLFKDNGVSNSVTLVDSPSADVNWILVDPDVGAPPEDVLEDGGTYALQNVQTGLAMTMSSQIYNGKLMDAMVGIPYQGLETQKFRIEKYVTYGDNNTLPSWRWKTSWSIKVFKSLSGYSEFLEPNHLSLNDFDLSLPPQYSLYDTFSQIGGGYSIDEFLYSFFFEIQPDGSYKISRQMGDWSFGVYDIGSFYQSPVVDMQGDNTWRLVPVPDIPFDGNVYNDPVENNGVYTIQNLNSGYNVNVGSYPEYTQISQGLYGGGESDWRYEYKLQSLGNNLWTILHRPSTAPQAQWNQSIEVGKSLDVFTGIEYYDKNQYSIETVISNPSNPAQQFILERQQNGSYMIKSALPNTNLYMIVYTRSLNSGAGIVFGDFKAASLWLFNPIENQVPPPSGSGNYIEKWGLFGLGFHMGITKELSEQIQDILNSIKDIADFVLYISSILTPFFEAAAAAIAAIAAAVALYTWIWSSVLAHFTTANGVWINIYLGIPVGFGGR